MMVISMVLLCGTVYRLTCVHCTFQRETKNVPFLNCLLNAHFCGLDEFVWYKFPCCITFFNLPRPATATATTTATA